MNQGAADMEAETQEPQNEENDKDCPEHNYSLMSREPGIENQFRAPRGVASDD
jgi:hypothetical protein